MLTQRSRFFFCYPGGHPLVADGDRTHLCEHGVERFRGCFFFFFWSRDGGGWAGGRAVIILQ
jgi:hypothetical protein